MNFYYYNAFITLNGEKTNIPFSDLLMKVVILDAGEKFKVTRYGEYSLLRAKLPENNLKDINDVSTVFADYRERKPKVGEKRSNRIDDIEDDVLEYTTFFYQNTNKLLIMQYNHYGAKIKQFEYYLNRFLPSDHINNWGVEIIEIPAPVGLDDVFNSNEFKFIDIKMDVSVSESKNIYDISKTQPRSISADVLGSVKDAQENLGGNIASIYFGNGRKRSNLINPDEAKKLLASLDLESDLYVSIKVKYFSEKLKKVHELNLKNSAVLKNEVSVDGDSWEAISDGIEIDFYENGRIGENNARSYQLISAELPDLVITPYEVETEKNEEPNK
ncbi:DUF6731 family protein [Alkalicoccobacillus murimartini]|uniref:Phage portal protein n=1 Tax=Alkalicoccobacillus murimartini TaxID=171685 RepID=A0ABT9YE23_9BACI|nr:DUF6731 family protein [Alkalicoccobacillus murimartini]MDQ0206088.1 hypothetical protein [Alkalicoccobacillus murimartini]